MDVEMVEAIGNLWTLVLVLLLIVCVIVFRKQLQSLIERLTGIHIKRGQTEISLTQEAKEAETIPQLSAEERTASEEKSVTEPDEKIQKLEPETADEWESEMLNALIWSRDLKRGEEAFKRMQESEVDDVKKLKNEAFYLWLRYDYGDTSVMTRLQEMATQEGLDQSVRHIAQRYIGNCYRTAGDFRRSARAHEAASAQSQSDKERAEDITQMATSLHKAGEVEQAFFKLMHEIGATSDPDALSTLYKGLGSLYELDKDYELRAISLEKALEINPNDTDILFNIAYSYGEKGLDALALLHYTTLLKFKSDNPMALNNAGIHYSRQKMPIRAADCYKKSAELDETLAAANLAYEFLNAGFKEEASQVLDKVKQQPKLHPNVGKAISAIHDSVEAESQTEKDTVDTAREQQQFMLRFAEAYFKEIQDCPSLSGSWVLSDDTEVHITQGEDTIEANWTSDSKKFKLTGNVNNLGIKLIVYKEQYVWGAETKLDFVKESTGYRYQTADGLQIIIMTLKDGKHSFIELARKS